jgi:hypothetical protein
MSILATARSWFRICALTVGLALWGSPALAATRSISSPITTVLPFGEAEMLTSILRLPPTGTPGFNMLFVLPFDYVKNGTVQIVLYLSAAGGGFPCTVRIAPLQLERKRIGLLPVNNLSGLSAANGTLTVDVPDGAILGKTFNLKPGSEFPDQRKGDTFMVGFRREPRNPTDTCPGNSFVHAVDVRYPVP